MNSRHLRALLCTLLYVASWQSVGLSAAERYSVVDLGVSFPNSSYALGINNRDQVVGYWLSPTGARAFMRDGNRLIDLGTLGGTNDYALSVNVTGQVVGFSEWDWGVRAFLNDHGTLMPLDALAGTNIYAYGINDAGHIVGYVETPAGASAFLYRDDSSVSYLSPISFAFGVNNSDQIVGTAAAKSTDPLRAFRWDNGTITDLTSLLPRGSGWKITHARAINERGAIVGWGMRRNAERAFLLSGSKITGLGVLPRGTNSYAFGLNNSNQVVGASRLRTGNEQAFLWRRGRLLRLNDLLPRASGWDLREARGINDAGSIVGWGTYQGRDRAFLLKPVNKEPVLSVPPVVMPPPEGIGGLIFRAASGGMTINITNPAAGSSFVIPTNISVSVDIAGATSAVSQVDFYANGSWIGRNPTSPYGLTWSNAVAGIFELKAVAIDGFGNSATSSVVTITNSFSPSTLTGLRIWLNAGIGVTTNSSGEISQWSDQSGNTNHATQATASQKPLLILSALNGLPVVRFDGTNDWLAFQRYTASNSFSVYTVLKTTASHEVENEQFGKFNPNPGTSGQRYLFGGVDPLIYGVSEAGMSVGTNGLTVYEFERQSSGPNFFNPIAVHSGKESASYSVVGMIYAGRRPSIVVNGALVRAALDSTRTNVVFSQTMGKGYANQSFAGDVAEVLVFNRVLNAEEEAQITSYLNSKYQLFSVPPADAALDAEALAPEQVIIEWNQGSTNTMRSAILERKSVDGEYTSIATVTGRRSYLDTNVVSATAYTYRLRFRNLTGVEEFSSEDTVTTPATGDSLPLSNLKLWLQAGSGHEAVNAGSWTDLSGSTNFANQLESTNRPAVVNGAINNWPVLRFDGTNDRVSLMGYFVSNTFTVLAVARTTASHEIDAESNSQSASGGSSGQRYLLGGMYPYVSFGEMSLSFGTNGFSDYEFAQNSFGGNHYAPLAVYQGDMGTNMNLLMVSYSNQVPSLYRNTALVRSGLTSTRTSSVFTVTIGCGQISSTRFPFAGDLAELMVFDRQLTPSELGVIARHLNGKYAFASPENGDVVLSTRALSGTEVALSWKQADATVLSSYIIERRLGTNGSFTVAGQVTADWRFIDTGLASGTLYTYRVRNTLNSDPNDYSNESQVQTLSSATAFPSTDTVIWLRAEDIVATNGASVSTWPDYGNSAQSATQTNASSRPLLNTNGIGSLASVTFSGGSFLELPSVFTNLAEAEIFVVLTSLTNSPATNQGLWQFNTNGPTYYPATNSAVQDAFGSTNTPTIVGPLSDLQVASIYNVASATNLWRARLNGPVKQLLGTNTVRFLGTPLLGRSTQGASEPFAGSIAEVIAFNRVLSLEEQKTVRDSLAQRYSITLELPHTPTNLALIRTNSTAYHLSWSPLTGSENGFESYFVVERQVDTNAPFLAREALSRTDSAYADSPDLLEVDYGYQLRAINDVGETVSSTLTAALTDTDGDGVPDYLETILGTNPNDADTDGDGLPDAWELKYGLNPRSASGRDGASGDFDNDGISNLAEYLQGSDPSDGTTGDDPLIRLRVHRPN